MQASQIKVGQQYAHTTTPRKGVTDLYAMSARRVRVREMYVQRHNPTGGEDQSGSWKNDGIRVDHWDGTSFVPSDTIYKARDFLMPWPEYQAERDKRRAIADKQAAAIAEAHRIHNERLDVLRADIAGYDLRHTDDSRFLGFLDKDGHTQDFTIPDGSQRVIMTIEAAERLMAGVAERIYEAIRDAS
jgi:hypothetical protein